MRRCVCLNPRLRDDVTLFVMDERNIRSKSFLSPTTMASRPNSSRMVSIHDMSQGCTYLSRITLLGYRCCRRNHTCARCYVRCPNKIKSRRRAIFDIQLAVSCTFIFATVSSCFFSSTNEPELTEESKPGDVSPGKSDARADSSDVRAEIHKGFQK